jgi:hypothetical protein
VEDTHKGKPTDVSAIADGGETRRRLTWPLLLLCVQPPEIAVGAIEAEEKMAADLAGTDTTSTGATTCSGDVV